MKLNCQKVAQLTGHNAAIFSLLPDQEDRYFFSGAGDGWIVRWDLDAPDLGKLVARVETQVFSMAAIPEQQLLVIGNMNGGVHWVDINEPEQQRNISHHQKGVFGIKPVGKHILTIGGGGLLTRWSVEERRTLDSIQLSNQSLRSIDYHAGRNELAIGSSDNNIYLLDATDLSIRQTIPNAHDNSVFSIRYSPDGRHLLSGGRDAHLRVWDTNAGFEQITSQPAHWFTINAIAFHPNGQWFATASRDKTIKIWDSSNFRLLKVLETIRDGGHVNSVNNLLWSPYQNYLISCSDDRSMIVWEISGE